MKLIWCLCFFSLVRSQDLYTTYDEIQEYLKNALNIDGIQQKIQSSLPNLTEADMVAFRMLDASTKIPTGVMELNFFDLGNFDECLKIEYRGMYGKYCLGKLNVPLAMRKHLELLNSNKTFQTRPFTIHPQIAPRAASSGVVFQWAACVPSSWKASEIPGLLTYTEDSCSSRATEPELSTGAIVTIVILSIFLAIIVASTVFDIFLYYSKKECPHELLIAFSFLTNGRKVFKATKNPDQLLCLNGIRALSMMWVIIGHEYSNIMNTPISNILAAMEWQSNSANMFIEGATVSVDTFFAVGGLVTVYTFLKSMDKGVKFNLPLFYLHRYLRLTPAFVIMSLIHLFLLNYVANGPIWKEVDATLVEPCEKGWWSSFLYITNYVEKGICLPQTWYLSVDMQLFILSPLILIPLSRWPKIGLGLLGCLTIAGCIVPFVVGYVEHLGSMLTGDQQHYMSVYYSQTYTRFGPYVIGMILGYVLYKAKKGELNVRLKPLVVLLTWLVCITGLVACVYAGYPLNVAKEEDRWGNALFLAFNRNAWAVALCGVIFLCVTGYGGPIDGFLSLPIFQFLTKVSYSMYLVHYAVITVRFASMKTVFRFSDVNLMHAFWGDFMCTLGLSLLLCLSFESPIIILEKYLFGHNTKKPVQQSQKGVLP